MAQVMNRYLATLFVLLCVYTPLPAAGDDRLCAVHFTEDDFTEPPANIETATLALVKKAIACSKQSIRKIKNDRFWPEDRKDLVRLLLSLGYFSDAFEGPITAAVPSYKARAVRRGVKYTIRGTTRRRYMRNPERSEKYWQRGIRLLLRTRRVLAN